MTARAILPGSVIGVLGGGQLGRMFAMAARRMGYRVHTLAPEHDTPTGQIADVEVVASYDDVDRIREFARDVDVVTFEFENVSAAAVAAAESHSLVRPNGRALDNIRRPTYTVCPTGGERKPNRMQPGGPAMHWCRGPPRDLCMLFAGHAVANRSNRSSDGSS